MRRCSSPEVSSQHGFQIWPHDLFDAADASEFHELIYLRTPSASVEPQGLQDCIETELVAIFKTVGKRLLGAVYAQVDAVLLVKFDALGKRGTREPKEAERGMRQAWWFRPAR